MEVPNKNMRTSSRAMRNPRFKLIVATVGIMLTIVIFKKATKSISQPKMKIRPIDLRSLELTKAESKRLWNESGLTPIKSRGATLFVDNDGFLRIPPADIVERLEFRDLEEMYHRYLASIQIHCKRQIHIGHTYDGGYEICQDKEVAPSNECLAYSFGIFYDFTFDDGIQKEFGCEVHSFDPSNGMKEHEHAPHVHFHPIGIGDKDETNDLKWTMRRLQTIRRDLGHTERSIDILKIDIEAGEWTALPDIISSGQLKGVKQLVMEAHSVVFGAWHIDRSHDRYRKYLNLFRQLYDEGFRIFFYRLWIADCCLFKDEFGNQRSGCHEIHMMRV